MTNNSFIPFFVLFNFLLVVEVYSKQLFNEHVSKLDIHIGSFNSYLFDVRLWTHCLALYIITCASCTLLYFVSMSIHLQD